MRQDSQGYSRWRCLPVPLAAPWRRRTRVARLRWDEVARRPGRSVCPDLSSCKECRAGRPRFGMPRQASRQLRANCENRLPQPRRRLGSHRRIMQPFSPSGNRIKKLRFAFPCLASYNAARGADGARDDRRKLCPTSWILARKRHHGFEGEHDERIANEYAEWNAELDVQ